MPECSEHLRLRLASWRLNPARAQPLLTLAFDVRVALRPIGSAQAPSVVREVVGVARQVKARPNETEDLIQL